MSYLPMLLEWVSILVGMNDRDNYNGRFLSAVRNSIGCIFLIIFCPFELLTKPPKIQNSEGNSVQLFSIFWNFLKIDLRDFLQQ